MLSIVDQPSVVPVPGELSSLAKAILYQDLKRPPKPIRERLALCRTGLECDGVIGPRSTELHLHQHNTLPPVVQKMLEDKMREIQALQGSAVLEAEVVADGATISQGSAGQD